VRKICRTGSNLIGRIGLPKLDPLNVLDSRIVCAADDAGEQEGGMRSRGRVPECFEEALRVPVDPLWTWANSRGLCLNARQYRTLQCVPRRYKQRGSEWVDVSGVSHGDDEADRVAGTRRSR